MRRFWYAKYAVTLLAFMALTFHLLCKEGREISDSGDDSTLTFQTPFGKKFTFTKSSSYLMRKLSQGFPVGSNSNQISPRWTILPGNVTIHEGRDHVPFDVSFDIRAENVCKGFDVSRKTLLVLIASTADHFQQRKAIRDTWGLKLLQSALNYRVAFLIGRNGLSTVQAEIEREGFRYGDLVQINLTESFQNLGMKSVAGLHWSKRFCSKADFLMKTDDDIMVHIPNLLEAVAGHKSSDLLLTCHENRMRKILRREIIDSAELPPSYHKYEVPRTLLPGTYYPPYCSGMAYVFTRPVRDRLLEASLTTPIFFIEDVYLTGFCRHKAGIVLTPHAGITLRPAINRHQASCSFREGRITSQEVEADELRNLWAELNTQGFFCPQLLGYKKYLPENEVSSL